MNLARSSVSFVVLLVSTVLATFTGCSSGKDDTAPTPCAQAKQIALDCNAQPSPGGVKVTVNFDQARCEARDDAYRASAACIVEHQNECNCPAPCIRKGTCP